jgi:hypothetical protein
MNFSDFIKKGQVRKASGIMLEDENYSLLG